MSERKWEVGDEVTLSHTQYVGDESVDWDELGIINDIDDGMATVINSNDEEFEYPLSELVEY